MQMAELKKRMVEIEDRKIEILMETGRINRRYKEAILKLNEEYEDLDEEYFRLRLVVIGVKNRIIHDSNTRVRES